MTSDAVLSFDAGTDTTQSGADNTLENVDQQLTHASANDDDEHTNCASCGTYFLLNAAYCHKCGLAIGATKKANLNTANTVPVQSTIQPLNVESNSKAKATSFTKYARKRTRWIYAYYGGAHFFFNLVLFFVGIINSGWMFYGFAGVGLSYFFGMFIPAIIVLTIFIADFKVWRQNRNNNAHTRLIVNVLCFDRQWSGLILVRLWMASIVLRLFFGMLIALPSGSLFLPSVSVLCVVFELIFLCDFKLYYLDCYYNGVFGVYLQPWYFLALTMVLQTLYCLIVVYAHFIFHYHCVYDSQRTASICYDWIPYYLLVIVYFTLLMYYYYYYFTDRGFQNNIVGSVRVLRGMRVAAMVVFISICWMMIEIMDNHFYYYDVTAFMLLWFTGPTFWTLLTKFQLKNQQQ